MGEFTRLFCPIWLHNSQITAMVMVDKDTNFDFQQNGLNIAAESLLQV